MDEVDGREDAGIEGLNEGLGLPFYRSACSIARVLINKVGLA